MPQFTDDIPADDQPRLESALDTKWRFHLGDTEAALNAELDDSDWEDIRLPHDWAITCPTDPDMEQGRPQGYQRRGHVGWYRRWLRVRPVDGKRYRLRLDGAYRHTEVWINGHSLGLRPFGYATHIHDITDYLKEDGEQLLAVRCDNTGNDGDRWYCGAGLYRRVWLTETGDVAAAPWGVSVTTPEVSEAEAVVNIELTVQNTRDTEITAEIAGTILDAGGAEQGTLSAASANVHANGEEVVKLQATVQNPELWAPESPALYSAQISIAADGAQTDKVEQPFGIRSIAFDVENGFKCNGTSRKMKGVCLHHDLGCLGTAFFSAGWERRLRLLKDLGCNAIRTSHNIPSPELLDLCDRLGFFVIDEAFDKWWSGCSGDSFGDWWQRDIESMVLRDRNHPCVVVWSTGNEVEEQGSERMLKTSKMLADYIKELDATRPTLVALRPFEDDPEIWNAPVEEKAEIVKNVSETVDIVGLNYQDQWYEDFHKVMPDQVFLATEAFHYYQHRDRGSWAFHAMNPWLEVAKTPYVAGQFLWTGIEYRGECSQLWPVRGWKGAPIDCAGYAKPRAWWHAAAWREEPTVRIAVRFREGDCWEPPDWSFPPLVDHWTLPVRQREMIEVWVFSNGHSVDLLLNDGTWGSRVMSECENRIAKFDVPYAPGNLVAISRDENGTAAARHEIKTAGEPAGVKLSADRETLKADDQDLAHITVEIVDENGVRVPSAADPVGIEVLGEGRLIGMDNGDLTSHETYDTCRRHAYHGRCLAVVRAGHNPGPITVTAIVPGLPKEKLTLASVNTESKDGKITFKAQAGTTYIAS